VSSLEVDPHIQIVRITMSSAADLKEPLRIRGLLQVLDDEKNEVPERDEKCPESAKNLLPVHQLPNE
jgi:hypothetical protein